VFASLLHEMTYELFDKDLKR